MEDTIFSDITLMIRIVLLLESHRPACSDVVSLHRLSSGFLNVLEVLKHNVKIGLGTGKELCKKVS